MPTLLMTPLIAAVLALVAAACGGGEAAGDDPATQETDAAEDAGEAGDTDQAAADSDEPPFFEGKTLEIWVPSNPGGGSDLSMQAFAAAIREFVDGNPEVELQYKSSAGGYEAGNDYFRLGEYDGETLLNVNLIKTTAWMAGDEGVGWDLNQMVPIAVLPPTHMWGVRADTGITELAQLADPPADLILGGRSPIATTMPDAMALGMLGIQDHFQEIYGYGGHSDMVLAFEQEEFNFMPASSAGWTGSAHLVEDGVVNLIGTHGIVGPDGELAPDPAWPDVPVILDHYEEIADGPPSDDFVSAYKQVVSIFNSGATLALHQDAPPEAITALRDGIARAAEDSGWQETKTELVGDVPVIVGDDVLSIEDVWASTSPEDLEFIREYLFTTYADILE